MSREVVQKGDIRWMLTSRAVADLSDFRREMGEDTYAEERRAFQEFFCDYINTGSDCQSKGCNVSPLGRSGGGGKLFKVRWALPGGGKSGGLRLAVVAYCAEKRVMIAAAWLRREDPGDADFTEASEDV